MNRIVISPRHRLTLERHASVSYPEECCGVLLGRAPSRGETLVERVLPVGNDHRGDRRRGYAIAPETVLAAQKEARAQGLEVVGYYHSHPDCPAQPSESDRETAWPDTSYLILSVHQRRVEDVRSWRLDGGAGFVEEAMNGTLPRVQRAVA